LLQSTSIRLLVVDAIARGKAERFNSHGVPELEAILSAVDEMQRMLLATTAPAETILEEKALSIRRGFANWWRHDHVTILGRSFDMSLFAAGLGLYSPYAKGNFTFERVICGWRTGLSVVDLRLKR
jgi:hypothetical protein